MIRKSLSLEKLITSKDIYNFQLDPDALESSDQAEKFDYRKLFLDHQKKIRSQKESKNRSKNQSAFLREQPIFEKE